MEEIQASEEAHLSVLQSRIKILKKELATAMKDGDQTALELEHYRTKMEGLKESFEQSKKELTTDFNTEKQEYTKQIKLAREMLEKKKEERKALTDYLFDSDLSVTSTDDLKNFDWEALQKLVSGPKSDILMAEKKEKFTILNSLVEKCRSRFNEMFVLYQSTTRARGHTRAKIDELREFARQWKDTIGLQEDRIAKMQTDTECLNNLIKQCALTKEPMSEFVTKNVRAKCHSFLNSSDATELITGLLKYRERQEKIIKLLRHKDNKLATGVNLLQVAKDQTTDHMQYYLDIIKK